MKWTRISISTLLLTVVIVALGIRLWQTNNRLSQTEPELAQLRNEAGHLKIGNPNEFNVIQVPTNETYHWRWRIRLPDGVEARLICLTGEIPDTGFQTRKWISSDLMLGSKSEREFFLDISVAKIYQDVYAITASYNNNNYTLVEYDDGPPPWLEGLQQYGTTVTGDRKTEAFANDTRVPLIRLRSTPKTAESHGQGILAWLTVWKMRDTPRKAAAEKHAR